MLGCCEAGLDVPLVTSFMLPYIDTLDVNEYYFMKVVFTRQNGST